MSRHRYRINRQIKAASQFAGIKPETILRQAGISVRFFNDPDAALDPAQFFQIWHATETLTENSNLGLELGRRMAHLPFGSALVAFSCADTIRTGLDRLALFKPLVAPVRIKHQETTAGYSLQFLPLEEGLEFCALLANYEVSFFISLCRLLTGHHVIPRAVSTISPEPGLGDYVGCKPKKSMTPEITFRHSDIDRPLISENSEIWRGLEPILSKRLVEIDRSATIVDRVRAELMELLPSGRSTMDIVCRRLGLGRRNLQRMLSEEGTSFRKVLDDLRCELAVSYLRNEEMRIEEVSYLLAFTDPNSFYRA
ncbi:MAG: AraC family transcriptional regulator ligand-binding domain-containing protein, partial [Pseudomonadota bacterium]